MGVPVRVRQGAPFYHVRFSMRFRLIVEGEVRPRQQVGLDHVHSIRQQLHPQIKKIWDLPPMDNFKKKWLVPQTGDDDPGFYNRIENIGGKNYAPLISTHLAAELDILLLRQQAPGQLIGDGGDIDNRMKTLFDALRMPSKSEVLTLGTATMSDDDPLHCLLKDDALIHKVSIETDRLLKDAKPRELMAIISVKVLVTFASMSSVGLMVD
jgi:hypothetical protein